MRVHRGRSLVCVGRVVHTRTQVYFVRGANKGVAGGGGGAGVKPTAAAVLCVVLTFSEWPINFVYPPACIINARLPLPRETPWGLSPPARPPPAYRAPCLSKSQQSPSSLKLISNNRTLLITRPRRPPSPPVRAAVYTTTTAACTTVA